MSSSTNGQVGLQQRVVQGYALKGTVMLFTSCASIRGSSGLEQGHQSVGLVCSHSCIRHCAAKNGQEGNVSLLYDSCTAHDLGVVRH